ncbi:YokU family protein [Bacillus sp. S/N-304-OC-R1]|uniref:YokU family protein n=1 Tax=Bacillus sp. S/N-304-OC-R1 TaxID=2758034 RepID=UPI001C8E4412|nr:YokU family protein [Bacillus sp. S/N-304-OC-R1]MBY0122731.1 YokU family protein [Bacillus sp. S/N-304-OC-R1]
MEEKCAWCEEGDIETGLGDVYWELPDGTRAIKIREVPTVYCKECQMEYQDVELVKQIDDQLFLINTKEIRGETTYEKLMSQPKLLKRNYFDFTI